MLKEKLIKFKKILKLESVILGIYFLDNLPKKPKHYQDTACTALGRAFLKKETLVFDAKQYHQLCPGADYFLKLAKISDQKALGVYVRDEHVFENKNVCKNFLKSLPKFPGYLKNKFVVIKPFKIGKNPDIIILLVNPAQASRIIGLFNYKKYQEINDHFVDDIEYMFQQNMYPAIATHDAPIIEGAYKLIDKYQVTPDKYEFQMLYGVTPGLRKSILDKGHRMRVYVPFGKQWFGYCTRRLKENPQMAGVILKALFKKG